MLAFDELPSNVDLLVIGSGPVGSAIARLARRFLRAARILLVDAGAAGSPWPGEHLANLTSPDPRAERGVFDTAQHALIRDAAVAAPPARPGTELVFPPGSDLAAYARGTTVGGLGVRWTGATPRPDAVERDPWLTAAAWDAALGEAERLLRVHPAPWPDGPVTRGLADLLRAEYAELPAHRPVAQMPTAMTWEHGRPHLTGPRAILAGLHSEPAASFALAPRTICTELLVARGRVTGVRLSPADGSATRVVAPTVVAVAADAVHTPQLLWASGIRPAALGRYAGEHFQLLASVAVPGRVPAPWDDDRTAAMLWVPYAAGHDVHGQVMLFDRQPAGGTAAEESVAGLSWLVPPTIKRRNRIMFADSARDARGMPRPHADYPLCAEDRHRIRRAAADQRRAMRALGDRVLPGGRPRLLPRGSSLHLLGTIRAGATDDGHSVCDPDGRVWGLANLFVAGNGVISTSTAGNPTLTSVALAVRAAHAIARELSPPGPVPAGSRRPAPECDVSR